MGCKDCDEERAAKAADEKALGLAQTFAVPLPDLARVELRVWGGPLSPLGHGILKEWLGLVYDQLRPTMTDEVIPNG